MDLLWTVSNWKRTGPLEPSLDLAVALQRRGHRVRVAVGAGVRGDENEAEACVAARGLELVRTGARLHKHSAPWRDLPDAWRLGRYLRASRPDVVVTTLRNDHVLLQRAARRAGGIPVLRTWYGDGIAEPVGREVRALRGCDAVVVFGQVPLEHLVASGVAADRVSVTGAPLDLTRLRYVASGGSAERGAASAGDFLVGIVARMQTHRRFELLWEAVARLKERGVPFHLLAIGRGTHAEAVAHRPVAERCLEDVVSFPGYLRGATYAATVASLDAQILLVPGSDPTCRALREGMALGVPSVATRRGLLPEIVQDGVTGMLVDESAASLADALTALAGDPERARRLGAGAREAADATYDTDRVASDVESVLERLVHGGVSA